MKFETEIMGIGDQARDFRDEKILIFFGQRASGGLEDYSVLIKEPRDTVTICSGDVLKIGESSYPVTAVGGKVEETFSDLDTVLCVLTGPGRQRFPERYM